MTRNVIPVDVYIFGKEYPVACPPGEEDGLRKSAIRVDEEMRKVREGGKVVGTDRIAVMVALNLAYEILLNQQAVTTDGNSGTNAVDTNSQQRIHKLQQDIDAALELYQGELLKGQEQSK